jgi:geranylgeranyl pyrophosphate synthase
MKKILKKTNSCLVAFLFVLMFFQINLVSLVEIVGVKYPKSNRDFVEYYLPSGEKINIGSNEFKCLAIPFVLSVEPADNFMHDICPDGKYRQKCLPDKHKVVIKFKKVDEFKKEPLAILPLAAFTNKKDYFGAMNYVGECVDKVVSNQPLPIITQNLYAQRQGKARLRPLLSYLAYDLAGGQNSTTAEKLAAISETTNLHLYSHNYLIDGKNLEIQNKRTLTLLSSGQFFADLTTKLICELEIPDTNKVLILNRWAKETDLTYLGQIADVDLNIDNYPKEEDEYLAAYKNRSSLMSGPMYGFSFWLGYVAAGNLKSAEQSYLAGKELGLTLQIINDIADFSTKKSDAFSDWHLGKMTVPLYYLQKYRPEIPLSDLSEENFGSLLIASGAYDSSLELVKASRERTRVLISGLTDDRDHLINRVLAIGKDNKYFRQLKKA